MVFPLLTTLYSLFSLHIAISGGAPFGEMFFCVTKPARS
jgi:hypothetical protein